MVIFHGYVSHNQRVNTVFYRDCRPFARAHRHHRCREGQIVHLRCGVCHPSGLWTNFMQAGRRRRVSESSKGFCQGIFRDFACSILFIFVHLVASKVTIPWNMPKRQFGKRWYMVVQVPSNPACCTSVFEPCQVVLLSPTWWVLCAIPWKHSMPG